MRSFALVLVSFMLGVLREQPPLPRAAAPGVRGPLPRAVRQDPGRGVRLP
ncbi:MAG: hypothetical protein MZU79_02325 [Anaerotruncus sp.]|nr:hypothetical protein [Anaerotruncus sp.]